MHTKKITCCLSLCNENDCLREILVNPNSDAAQGQLIVVRYVIFKKHMKLQVTIRNPKGAG